MNCKYSIASIRKEIDSISEHFFSILEVAKILRVDYSTIRRLIMAGDIDASKVRGVWRIAKSAIREYLEKRHPLNTDYLGGK